jgi:3-oxocholest-4-en-26-oate---CoA ligase
MEGRRFDPVELLDTVERHQVNSMSIVGDAFAKPILRALDAEPGRWDISSLRVIVSSGVMWSGDQGRSAAPQPTAHHGRRPRVERGDRDGHQHHHRRSATASAGATAKFALGPNTRVVTDDGRDVVPGSGELGRVALRGFTPIGYYKDEEKSAATFQMIDGVRYSIPGDWAEVRPTAR